MLEYFMCPTTTTATNNRNFTEEAFDLTVYSQEKSYCAHLNKRYAIISPKNTKNLYLIKNFISQHGYNIVELNQESNTKKMDDLNLKHTQHLKDDILTTPPATNNVHDYSPVTIISKTQSLLKTIATTFKPFKENNLKPNCDHINDHNFNDQNKVEHNSLNDLMQGNINFNKCNNFPIHNYNLIETQKSTLTSKKCLDKNNLKHSKKTSEIFKNRDIPVCNIFNKQFIASSKIDLSQNRAKQKNYNYVSLSYYKSFSKSIHENAEFNKSQIHVKFDNDKISRQVLTQSTPISGGSCNAKECGKQNDTPNLLNEDINKNQCNLINDQGTSSLQKITQFSDKFDLNIAIRQQKFLLNYPWLLNSKLLQNLISYISNHIYKFNQTKADFNQNDNSEQSIKINSQHSELDVHNTVSCDAYLEKDTLLTNTSHDLNISKHSIGTKLLMNTYSCLVKNEKKEERTRIKKTRFLDEEITDIIYFDPRDKPKTLLEKNSIRKSMCQKLSNAKPVSLAKPTKAPVRLTSLQLFFKKLSPVAPSAHVLNHMIWKGTILTSKDVAISTACLD